MCPAPYPGCPAALQVAAPVRKRVCSPNDLQNAAAACAAGANATPCISFLFFDLCGACLAQFDYDFVTQVGIRACVAPYLDATCNHNSACIADCVVQSCDACFDLAVAMEGHPDNVAACVLGSIVAGAIDSGGAVRAVRLELPARFGMALVVPDFVLPTAQARAVLPSCYSKEDAVFNVQRAALLIAALAAGATSAFPAALEDRFHQPYREPLVPGLADILKLRAPGLLGCALSGAGPSILVFYERGYDAVCDLVRQIFQFHGHAAEILHTQIADRGFELT